MTGFDEYSHNEALIIEPSDDKINADTGEAAARDPESGTTVVNGDVDNVTGDIMFPGAVYVKGNIRDGHTVNAGAGIFVGGVVDAANLQTNGDIVLECGVRGANKAVIDAGGNIRANFLENCTVNAGHNVTANSILHSRVMCGGELTLRGRHGALIGGKAVVKQAITAISIGSVVSTPTELYVGYEPETMLLYNRLLEEYAETAGRYEEMNRSVHTLQTRGDLREDKKKHLLDLLRSRLMLRERLNNLRKWFDDILPGMETHNGVIRVSHMIYYGVKATIGNAVIYIRDDLANCLLTNIDGKINIGINEKGGE